MIPRWIAFILVLCSLGQTFAQSPPPCSDPKHRQFDFWLGAWDVYAQDRVVGHNRIERILGGCVLMENWEGNGGSLGHSFNVYNAASGKWEQTWVDNSGSVIYFKGGWDAAKKMMSFSATTPDTARHRMTFTPKEGGEVIQRWEAAAKGQDFRLVFEGVYKKREED